MHELSVVFSIIDQVEQIAKENKASKVNSITLQIGEVSMVIPSYLEDCFKWAKTKHDMFKECNLIVEIIKAKTYCEDCKKEYETVKYGKICPFCKSEHTYLLTGNQFEIKEIEIV
jgi:hydrogenase nickel incorporation protein HypA/HybF